jgi:putative phosphonate transport system ATP-binding protein
MGDDTLLAARDAALSFGPITALRAVDADVWPGEVLAIVGESGSGKTTLLNVLSGRIRPHIGIDRAQRRDGTERKRSIPRGKQRVVAHHGAARGRCRCVAG